MDLVFKVTVHELSYLFSKICTKTKLDTARGPETSQWYCRHIRKCVKKKEKSLSQKFGKQGQPRVGWGWGENEKEKWVGWGGPELRKRDRVHSLCTTAKCSSASDFLARLNTIQIIQKTSVVHKLC